MTPDGPIIGQPGSGARFDWGIAGAAELGSAICAAAGATGRPVVAGCLRNAPAVARWLLAEGYGGTDAPIGVVAAGERWPDLTLRPAVEDLLGAAAVLDGLSEVAGGCPSRRRWRWRPWPACRTYRPRSGAACPVGNCSAGGSPPMWRSPSKPAAPIWCRCCGTAPSSPPDPAGCLGRAG